MPLNAEITVTFKASNLIAQTDLDNWDGNGITLEDYVRYMVVEEEMLLDIIDDYAPIEIVSVKPSNNNFVADQSGR